MDTHVTAILAWAGPGLLSITGFVAFHGARVALKAFERVLRDNSSAHERMIEQLGRHELTLASHEMRIGDHAREHVNLRNQATAQQSELRQQGERIARLEAHSTIQAELIKQ